MGHAFRDRCFFQPETGLECAVTDTGHTVRYGNTGSPDKVKSMTADMRDAVFNDDRGDRVAHTVPGSKQSLPVIILHSTAT